MLYKDLRVRMMTDEVIIRPLFFEVVGFYTRCRGDGPLYLMRVNKRTSPLYYYGKVSIWPF